MLYNEFAITLSKLLTLQWHISHGADELNTMLNCGMKLVHILIHYLQVFAYVAVLFW